MASIDFPWPPKKLSPNGPQRDYRGKAAARKSYRSDCRLLAMAAKIPVPDGQEIPIRVDYFPPDRRKRDWDNCVAMTKGCFDGLADALGVDDSRFVPTIRLHREEPLGLVRVTL